MLRLVQEDLERARQWRLEKQQMQQLPLPPSVGSVGGPPQQQQPLTNGGGGGVNNNNTSTVPDQERMRKIEAFQRKQRELEATQAAEERIIREAQRRKEDEMLLQHQQRHLQQQQQQQQWRPQPGNVPIPPSHHFSAAAAAAVPSQRLDSLIVASSSLEPHVIGNVATTTKMVSFSRNHLRSINTSSTTSTTNDLKSLFALRLKSDFLDANAARSTTQSRRCPSSFPFSFNQPLLKKMQLVNSLTTLRETFCTRGRKKGQFRATTSVRTVRL